ncbi:hypothetical protein ACQUW5_09005 [Legionella sp. CNM-1927-20]|uniref:hypothetical protein n=1 Tax=Legionella sp. CNM-1927-20 TaxID=3422221 RepID=UPI00403AA729
MLSILNRSLGLIAGAIFYSVKSLLINLIITAGLISISLPVSLGFSFTLSYYIYHKTRSNKLDKKLISAFLAGITSLLFIPLTPIIFTALILATIADVATCTVKGITEGFKQGIFVVLTSTITDFSKFSSLLTFLKVVIETIKERNNLNPTSTPTYKDFNITVEDKIFSVQLLEKEEVQLASKIPTLKVVLAHYLSLCERLEQLDKAIIKRQTANKLENNELGTLDDELITDEVISLMPITIPVLLVKQYKDEHSNWKAVIGSTNISDLNNLQKSMKTCQRAIIAHPRTGEDLINEFVEPTGRLCRYRIYKYVDIKRSSQELFQAIKSIRAYLAQTTFATEELASESRAATYPFFNHKIQTNSLDKQKLNNHFGSI